MINFILGGLFLYTCLPLLDAITSAICARIEQYKAKCGLKIAEYNEEIAKITYGENNPRPMGFQYTSDEEDEAENEN